MSSRHLPRTSSLLVFFALLPLAALIDGGCAGHQAAPAAAVPAPAAAEETTVKVQAALAGPHRSEKNRQRDSQRHPAETLAFFGLRDDMTVIELWPGGGWYTEILGPVLAAKGKLFVTSYDPNGPADAYETKRAKEAVALLEKNRPIFGPVGLAIVSNDHMQLGPPASADLVLTFRNLHNWISGGIAEKVLAASFQVLKPGGTFGIVEHRGKPGQDPKSGYVEESAVIRMVEAAGFKLAAKSEVNANPRDTKDYPEGVWTLPPSLRLGDKDRAKYIAIGESDRMTLKFVKP